MSNIINIKTSNITGIKYTYIGRKNGYYGLEESKWANPYIIGVHGDRKFCIQKYILYLNTRPDLLLQLPELKDEILGCWCSPLPCHGTTLSILSKSKNVVNWFSNMRDLDEPFIYQGIKYKTVENFYQAMKIPKGNLELRRQIAEMNPYKAKQEIRDKSKYLWRKDWNKELSLQIMEYALRQKFKDGTKWSKKLEMTENWEIVEWNNWGDLFWGKDIKTKIGENNLGKLLMKIRGENKI